MLSWVAGKFCVLDKRIVDSRPKSYYLGMSFEKATREDSDFVKHEKEVASGEVTPKDRLENQIRLATIPYASLNHKNFDVETHEGRNKIMEFWTNPPSGEDGQEKKSFSESYREIEENPGFEKHPRLQGNIYNITVEDLLYYRENGELPEN